VVKKRGTSESGISEMLLRSQNNTTAGHLRGIVNCGLRGGGLRLRPSGGVKGANLALLNRIDPLV